MLNVLAIFVDRQSNIFIASYNPFEMDKNRKRRRMSTSEVEQENMHQNLNKVHKIFDNKMKDLQGFVLKFSTFLEP